MDRSAAIKRTVVQGARLHQRASRTSAPPHVCIEKHALGHISSLQYFLVLCMYMYVPLYIYMRLAGTATE